MNLGGDVVGRTEYGGRLIFNILLFFGVCFLLFFPEAQAAPPELPLRLSASGTAMSHAVGTDDLGVIPPEELVKHLDHDARDTRSWFWRERGSLLRFLLGAIVSTLLGGAGFWLFRRLTREVPGRTRDASWRRELLYVLVPPLIILLVLISCFAFFFPVLQSLPGRFHEWDMRFFYAAITLTVAWGIFGVIKIMDARIRRFAERSDNSLDDLTVGMVGNILKIAIAAATVMFVGQNIFDLNITALLAGAGVVGLAVALAAKDTVSYFFGTLVIVADCPFRIGDRISSGEINGIVTHVGMRSSSILTEDESICRVPNGMLTNAVVRNLSHRGYLKHVMDIGLTYDTTPEQMEQAIAILHGIMDDFHGPDAEGYAPRIYFSAFSPSSMNLRAIIWVKSRSVKEEELLLNELNFAVLKQLNAAGLKMAYPTQTVYLESDRIPSGGDAG